MTVLFIGHGSPMNALASNDITQSWQSLGKTIAKPRAILAISAHWYVPYLAVTSRKINATIHDFYGFPPQLANFDYPSHGSAELAEEVVQALAPSNEPVSLDAEWGLDHGVWSVLTHMYPKPDMPIVQLSIDSTKPPRWHYHLAQQLQKLSQSGVLILCSGNIVHNLGKINSKLINTGAAWAIESDNTLVDLIVRRDIEQLCNYTKLSDNVQLAIPTPEHFLPVLYALGASVADSDKIRIFNQVYASGSLSMTSFECVNIRAVNLP